MDIGTVVTSKALGDHLNSLDSEQWHKFILTPAKQVMVFIYDTDKMGYSHICEVWLADNHQQWTRIK